MLCFIVLHFVLDFVVHAVLHFVLHCVLHFVLVLCLTCPSSFFGNGKGGAFDRVESRESVRTPSRVKPLVFF